MYLQKFIRYSYSFLILQLPIQLHAGKYSAEFLRIGVGARALGIGGAYVALAEDGTASYWNAAGLGNLAHHQIHFSHLQMFDNLANHHFANVSIKITPQVGLGLSWIRLAIDDIPRYAALEGTRYDRILNPEWRSTGIPEGFFGDVEDALLLSIGRGFDFDLTIGSGLFPSIIPLRLNIGMSYKYISQRLDKSEGRGQGLDVGMLVKFFGPVTTSGNPKRVLSFGMNLQDVAGTTVAWNTANRSRDRLQLNGLFGISYTEWLSWIKSQLTLSVMQEKGYESTNHWGCELLVMKLLVLRSGISHRRFTAGAGLKIFWLRLDYAFVSYDLGNSHRISGAIEF